MPDPNESELYLLIQAKSYIDEVLKKVKGQVQDLAEASNKASEDIVEGNKPVGEGFKQNLRHMAELRRTVWRVRMIWMLSIGAMVKSMYDLRKEMIELNKLSFLTGKSVDELSQQIYGFKFSVESVNNTTYAMDKLKNTAKGIWMKIGEGVGLFVDGVTQAASALVLFNERQAEFVKLNQRGPSAAENKKMWNESRDASLKAARDITTDQQKAMLLQSDSHKAMLKETSQMELSAYHFKKWLLDQRISDLRAAGETEIDIRRYIIAWEKSQEREKEQGLGNLQVETLKMHGKFKEAMAKSYELETKKFMDTYGEGGEELQIYSDYLAAKAEMEAAHTIGFQTQVEEWTQAVKTFTSSTQDFFYDTFVDAFDNNLKNASQIFTGFLITLRNAILKYLSNVMVSKVMGGLFGGMLGAGGLGFLGLQHGGIVTKPTIAAIGEKEPEAVIPLSRLGKYEDDSPKETNVNYFINAVDAASFTELVRRNPNAIVAITSQAIQQNKGIRRTIKELA